jgi:hypothetical protein
MLTFLSPCLASAVCAGNISHHEDTARLRALHSAIQAARSHVEGCMDPSAANYSPGATTDDGTCVFTFDDAGNLVEASGPATVLQAGLALP